MGAPPVSARTGITQSSLTAWGLLFDRPHQRGSSRPPLTLRERGLSVGGCDYPSPLFSGNWTIARYGFGDEEQSISSWLKLHLNPTRFVRYQNFIPWPSLDRNAPWPEPLFFADQAEREVNGEIVLNNDDNWIPSGQRWAAFSNPQRWRRHLRNYLNAIPELFEAELERSNRNISHGGPLVSWTRTPTLNLHSAEHFWEFVSANPTALVATLKPLLDSFTAKDREATAYRQDCDPSIDHNALSLRAEINPGRAIRIYAKTNRRVRIEVIHTLSGENGFRLEEGGHTSTNWGDLPGMLELLAEDAAELVNRMFEHFHRQSNVTPSHITAYQLLLEIAKYARSLPVAETIAQVLVGTNAIAAQGNGERVQKALQRLSGAGILEYKRRARNYVVTASRLHALQTLQQEANFSLLTARTRRRTVPRG